MCWVLCCKAICAFEKGGNRGIIIFRRLIGIIIWSLVSLPDTFNGITQGWWCWLFIFTMLGFGEKFKTSLPMKCKIFGTKAYIVMMTITHILITIEIRFHSSLLITIVNQKESFSQFNWTTYTTNIRIKKLLSWGNIEDDKIGDFSIYLLLTI